MSGSDTLPISLARGIATLGIGASLGLQLSFPILFKSAFNTDTLAPRDRLHLWSKTLSQIQPVNTPLSAIVIGSFSYASWAALAPPSWLQANLFARHRKATLLTSALLIAATLPYSVLFVFDKDKRLKDLEAKIIKDPTGSNGTAESDLWLQEWSRLHYVRIGASAIAFVLAVTELVSA
ncbi:hypothetical protein T439DRAFT_323424 [Meredithblackwellia eburnea MCA 4105]